MIFFGYHITIVLDAFVYSLQFFFFFSVLLIPFVHYLPVN